MVREVRRDRFADDKPLELRKNSLFGQRLRSMVTAENGA